MTTRERLLQEALGLPPEERELLAVELALSIEKEPGYDEAWAAEIERRLKAIDDGTEELMELEEFEAEVWGDLPPTTNEQ
ncbi:MAG: addiction module protein [Chloroflexi bacterium]|nr:addiction module protein [Chloroflexota bacterium]